MDSFPGIDLVVVNYKTPGDLWAFLNSYNDYMPETPHSLHVVNVCPEPGDTDVVMDWASRVPFLYSVHDTNVGYATACNLAVVVKDRECLAFFNADTRFEAGVVDECYKALMSRPDWAVLGPRQVDDYNRITHGGVFGTLSSPSIRGWQNVDIGDTYADVRDDVVTVFGSAYFIKRDVWDELATCRYYMGCPEVWERKPQGAFLPTQHYYEETYVSYHAQHHGYKVVYLGTQKMIHRWHKASPVGEVERLHWNDSQTLFRAACDFHGIPHD